MPCFLHGCLWCNRGIPSCLCACWIFSLSDISSDRLPMFIVSWIFMFSFDYWGLGWNMLKRWGCLVKIVCISWLENYLHRDLRNFILKIPADFYILFFVSLFRQNCHLKVIRSTNSYSNLLSNHKFCYIYPPSFNDYFKSVQIFSRQLLTLGWDCGFTSVAALNTHWVEVKQYSIVMRRPIGIFKSFYSYFYNFAKNHFDF